jgi:hypothetical protein
MINSSPTLVSDLLSYQVDIDQGKASGFGMDGGSTRVSTDSAGLPQVIFNQDNGFWGGGNLTYYDNNQVQHTVSAAGMDAGTLAHEMSHYMSLQNDDNLRQSVMDGLNSGNYSAEDKAASMAQWEVFREGEAAYGNWVIRNEILQAGGGEIYLSGANLQYGSTAGNNSYSNLQYGMDNLAAASRLAGMPEDVVTNILTDYAASQIARMAPNNTANGTTYWGDAYSRYLSQFGGTDGARVPDSTSQSISENREITIDTGTGAIIDDRITDGAGNVRQELNFGENGQIKSAKIVEDSGDYTVSTYNDDGVLSSLESVTSQTDGQGNVTTTTTTTNYDTTTGVETDHSVQTNDGHGNVTTSDYDANGNLTSYDWQTEGGASGSNTYGPNGQLTSETWNDGNGNSGTNTYGANGTLESSSWQTADGHSGTNNYDENGTLISDSWQSPDGTTGTDTYNSDGSRASDTWQSTNGSDGSDTYNSDGSVATSTVTTVTTNADGSVTTTTRWDNYSTNGGDYGGGYGGDYGGSYGDLYSEISTTINPDGSSVEVVNTNQYGYGDSTTTVTSADGSYNTIETTAMGMTWETSYDATTGEHDTSTIYNDGSRTDTQELGGTTTTTSYNADGSVWRTEVATEGSDITTTYNENGSVSVDQRTGDDHVIETTNPDGSHSETRVTNEWNNVVTDNYDASGRLTSESGENASLPTSYTSSGTIDSQWETTYNSDGSSSTHEWETAWNGSITHDTETDAYGHTVSTSTTVDLNGISLQNTQNADGSHSTAYWDTIGNYNSNQYDASGHDIRDVSRSADGSYSDQTYDPATGTRTEHAYNASTGEHSTYEGSYDANGIHHETETHDYADGSTETLQTDTINGISLTIDTSSDGTIDYYMNGGGITVDQFDQYWQDYFAGDSASNDPGAGDPGTGDPGASDGSSSTPDMSAGTTDQQAAA